MREVDEIAGLTDNDLNSGQHGLQEVPGQLECSREQARQIRFPFSVARTMAPSPSVRRSAQDSIRPDQSHSRYCRSDGRAALLENRDRALRSRDRSVARHCPNVHDIDNVDESDGMSGSIVSMDDRTRHIQGDAAIDQGTTSSGLPHRRQFWQSTQFQVFEKALQGFRRKWGTLKYL